MRIRPGGFTLSELLVALALGTLLVAAVLSSAAVVGRRHAELEQVARLHERGNHALGVLAPELQLAGFGGLAPMAGWNWPAAVPVQANACGTLALPLPWALRIDTTYGLACDAHGGGAALESDVLTVLRAGAHLSAPAAGRLQVLTSRRGGALQRVIDAGALPAELRLVAGLDELRDLQLQSFYVARDSDGAPGLPALRLKSLTAIEGHSTVVDQEIVPGIELLCIESALPAAAGDGLLFTHSAGAFAPAGLPAAVRVSLLLRSERPWGTSRDQAYDCANRHVTRHDAFLRRVATRTWAVRNATRRESP